MICRRFFFAACLTVLPALAATAEGAQAVTLAECVAMALDNNPDIQLQQLNVQLADQDISERQAANFGSLSVVASYNHYNLPRTLAPLTPATIADDPASVSTTRDLFLTGVVYELPLFTGFAQTRSVEISNLQKEMAASRLSLSREQLIYNVKSIYVNILSLQAREKAQHEYVKALQRLQANIDREFKLGKKARIDQLKAGADVKNGAAEEARIASDRAILQATLASLLNVDQLTDFKDIPLSAEAMTLAKDTFSGQTEQLQRIKTARLEVAKNTKLAEKEQSALYPQLVFNTSYGQNFGPNDDTNKYSGDWDNQEVWQAGLNLQWKIFDFGSSKAKIQKARTQARQSRYALTKTELELKRALQEAVTKINTAVSDYESAREEHAMTRETEAIEQVRYDQGAADINDLLYAKARNQLALSRLIAAGYSYTNARFYLDYLLEQGDPARKQPEFSTTASARP
jgi:outer membrane protein TolC